MIKEEIIESIVKTYCLPVKKKSQIISMAIQRIENFETFQDVYNCIDFLVEKFNQTFYQERFFTRLDSLVNEDSKTQFHELISLPDYLEEDNQRDLKEKLKELAKQKGPLVILGRPIIQIEPVIKFGRRKYDENNTPLDLYKGHFEFYEGKSRTEVFQIDSGMYESLRRWNQLHLAIPEVRDTRFKGIPKKKEKEIIKTFKVLKSPTAIAKKLNVSRATVDFHLIKKHQLRTPNKKTGNPGYPKQMIEDVIECLRKCKKASKVAGYYGISTFTVIKHGRKAGVPILSRGGDIENILKNQKHTPKTF